MFKIGDRVRVIATPLTSGNNPRIGKTGTIKDVWMPESSPLYYVRPDHWPDEPLFAYVSLLERELVLVGEEDAATDLFAEAEQIGEPIVMPELNDLQLTDEQLKNARRKE